MNTWTKDKDCTTSGLVLWALEDAAHAVEAEDGTDTEGVVFMPAVRMQQALQKLR